ncbi:MAG: PAS domain S-box protein [Bacteroidota bacterium]
MPHLPGEPGEPSGSLQNNLLKQYKDLFDHAPFGYIMVDPAGKIILFNQSFCRILRIDEPEVTGRSFQSFLDDDDQQSFVSALAEAFDSERKIIREFSLTGAGKGIFIRSEAFVSQGELLCKVAIIDIAEKKFTEDALTKSEEKYRMLIELAVDAFFQGDRDGNFITVNDKAVEMTGYTRQELLHKNMRELFLPENLVEKPLRYDLLLEGQTIKTERVLHCKDGRNMLVEMTSKAMPDGTYQSFFRDITERRAAEKAISDSERKYRNLHMSMMDGYVLTDMNGVIIESNEAFRQMLGYQAEELTRLTYRDLTPEKWHDYEQRIVDEQIMVKGHSLVYQKEYRKKDGTVFPIEIRTFLIRNTAGEEEGMWAIVREITERKRAEEALRRSEEKFRSVVESSPTAMYFYHLETDGRLILTGANPASDQIIGISHKGLLGKTITEAFPSLCQTGVPDMYRKVAKNELGPQTFEIEYDDERFSGFYSVHVFRTGPDAISVDFVDITSRKQTEEALRRSEIEYRDTLDSLPDWIYVVDLQHKIVMFNAALKSELARHGFLNDCLGQEIMECFPFISKQTIAETELVFSTGLVSVGEQDFVMNGKTLHVEITAVPILKDNKTVKVILVIRDRSKEKENEELKRRNADQKEVLLREIHHRVKNNLAIVISLLNFQLRNTTNVEITRMIIDIQTRIRSMALIHEHLYRSENLDRMRLAAYLESLSFMILTTFSGHRVKLETNLEAIDVSIEAALPIGLIVNELLTNAFKYAFPGNAEGIITILLEKAEGDMCRLVVEDDGVGLPASSTLDSEKSLGLYIVGLLVEQLEGSVEIDRKKGTSFRIRFRNLLMSKENKPIVSY